MIETPLTVQGLEVTAFERVGYIDGAVRWAVELEDGRVVVLTSKEFGQWVDASREPLEAEPELSRNAMIALGGAAVTAVLTVGYGWCLRVGLL